MPATVTFADRALAAAFFTESTTDASAGLPFVKAAPSSSSTPENVPVSSGTFSVVTLASTGAFCPLAAVSVTVTMASGVVTEAMYSPSSRSSSTGFRHTENCLETAAGTRSGISLIVICLGLLSFASQTISPLCAT